MRLDKLLAQVRDRQRLEVILTGAIVDVIVFREALANGLSFNVHCKTAQAPATDKKPNIS